jgi:TPP-dependent pyruvate/acetoin dehydrogenase alpha subunit
MTGRTAAFYRTMRTIRRFEERLLAGFSSGELNGTTHTCIGQEHIAAGYFASLDLDRDIVFSNHRCHGHFIAYCDAVDALARELTGKRGAINAGIGGSQHIKFRNFYTNGVQGGIVSNAAGAALAEKRRGAGAIVSVFMGDGTLGEGVVYETLNIASLWHLPLVFVLENNCYAQSTPTKNTIAGSIAARFEAFAIPVTVSDAVTPDEVEDVSRRAVEKLRREGGPTALVFNTYRLGPHSKSDDTRDPLELQERWAADPLAGYRLSIERGIVEAIDAQVEARLDATFAAAGQAPASRWEYLE